MKRILTRARLFSTLSLLVLLVVCLTFSWSARDVMARLPFLTGQGEPRSLAESQGALVDLSPWRTARTLAELAATVEDVEYAREAEHLADHEVYQAFASALRQASAQHHSLTGTALTLSQKFAQFQQIVKEDQSRVQSLTQAADRSSSSAPNHSTPVTVADDLDIAKAQLGLDSDELADAQQELARAVGDQRSRIQQELAAHESAMREYDAQSANETHIAAVPAQRYGTLVERLKAWIDQRTRCQLIQQATQRARADTIALTAQHDKLPGSTNTASSENMQIPFQPVADPVSDPTPDKTAKLIALRDRTAERQLLNIYDDRIQTEQQLAAVYARWSDQLLLQHRIVLHLLLQSFALIAFILICVIIFDALVRNLVDRPTLDRRRMQTLRIIFKLGIQLFGVVLILLVTFGSPNQMPTILGLSTAGLTLVLQDFIIAFFGWFVLMGKNGIRVGDWVEINSVGGEVVEIGLFRTVMLETGNWTDKGHPTGRRVTFINTFAIKGQYFNFSTTGQWMWDEIRVSIPAAHDTYAIIELIHKAVLKETEKDARLAEEEWKRVTRQNGLSQFAAGTAVDMRPGNSGIDIIVRYITRASDRFDLRNRLYQCVIDVLHKPQTPRTRLDVAQHAQSMSALSDELVLHKPQLYALADPELTRRP
ncbi:MAG: mechanosensitive ion channel family protein [Bryobacteraceae bacterium]